MLSGDPLLVALEARGPQWARDATSRMLDDPFWFERFGTRATEHSYADGQYHLRYLEEALRLDAPELFVSYARWLRALLVPRGMCTLHLVHHFAAFADAIARSDVPGRERAVALLQDAGAALREREGLPGRIEHVAPELADAAAGELAAGRSIPAVRADVAQHLSYLADAIELERPELFAGYLEFIDGFYARRSLPSRYIADTLDVVARLLGAHVDPADALTLAPLLTPTARSES